MRNVRRVVAQVRKMGFSLWFRNEAAASGHMADAANQE
jgi:hypothetical protein